MYCIDEIIPHVGEIATIRFLGRPRFHEDNGTSYSWTGMILDAVAKKKGEIAIEMFLLQGKRNTLIVQPENIIAVSEAQVNDDLREVLIDYSTVWLEQKTLLQRLEEAKSRMKQAEKDAIRAIQEGNGKYDYERFAEKVNEILMAHGYDSEHLICYSVGKNYLAIRQKIEFSKEANPGIVADFEKVLGKDHYIADYFQTCENHAPEVIPEFQHHSTTICAASHVTRKTICVERKYKFEIKYGLTKESLDEWENRIFG